MTDRRRERLEQWHRTFGQPVLERPQVPSDDRIRLRLKMLMEEAFECLEACYRPPSFTFANQKCQDILRLSHLITQFIEEHTPEVNLPMLADGLGDLDVIVEGTRLEFGIDGEPIAEAIHASNMAKLGPHGEVVQRPDGKVLKPEGWTPPDIEGELRKQGWAP